MSENYFDYRSLGRLPDFATKVEKASATDELDYSTLKNLKKDIEEYLEDLKGAVDIFEELEKIDITSNIEEVSQGLLFRLKVNQEVYTILCHILAKLNNTIDRVETTIKS